MFLQEVLTMVTQAAKGVFNSNFTAADGQSDFASLPISIEYPDDKQGYPGIWVDFEPTGQLESSGIDTSMFGRIPASEPEAQYRLWRFTGYATYTIVALTSLQRARLFDEVVRMMAFGSEIQQTSPFRTYIESNPFIAANFDFDQIAVRGSTANPGTPWGTEEVIYETTIAMECIGEFVSSGLGTVPVPLRQVFVEPPGLVGQINPYANDGAGAWR